MLPIFAANQMFMNKLLPLSLAATLLSLSASAQLTKGHKLLGGSINGYTNTIENSNGGDFKHKFVSVSPSLGFFVADNKVVGALLGYSHLNSNGTKGNAYTAGGFYRQYLPLNQKFYLFGEAALNLSTGKDDQPANAQGISEVRRQSIATYLTPGIAFAASRRFMIEATVNNLVGINYQRTKTKYSGSNTTDRGNSFSLSSNVASNTPVSVGFRILLGK